MVAGINPAELKTDQTIVKTDRTGNGKFLLTNLPPDYDFIRIASAVRITPEPDYYVNAANLAADEFLARNQRPAAAQFLGKILQTWNAQSWNKKDKEEFLDVADNLKKRIASITEPNGTFDTDKRTLLAGEPERFPGLRSGPPRGYETVAGRTHGQGPNLQNAGKSLQRQVFQPGEPAFQPVA